MLVLPVTHNLPLIKVLRHIGLKLPINFIWIDSPLRWRWPKFTLLILPLNLIWIELFADVKIRIVFLVVKKNVIVVDYEFTVFTILIPWMDLVGYSLGWGFGDEFYLLASSVGLRYLLSELQVVSGVSVLELDVLTVANSFTPHFLNVFVVVVISDLNSFL